MTLFHFGGEDLRIVPLAGRALTRPLHLVRREGRSLSVAAQALYDLLRERRVELGGGIDWREALWDGHRPYIMLSSAWVT